MGLQKLGLFPDLFPDLIGASLLGAAGLLFTYHDKLNIAIWTIKDIMVDVISRQEEGFLGIQYILFHSRSIFRIIYQDYSIVIYIRTVAGPNADVPKINDKYFRLHLVSKS